MQRSPNVYLGGARSCGALLAFACILAGTVARAQPQASGAGPSATGSSSTGASAAGGHLDGPSPNAVVGGPSVPAGADALASARAAWQDKHFAAAELSYKSALDHGGLAAADTLDAYVHLGAARAALGKKELARVAFRQAALIDRHFKLPPGASKRAAAIAALARKDEAKIGSILLSAKIPQSVPGTGPFPIDAAIDPKHAALTARVAAEARDPLTGKHWETGDVAASKMHFEVPADVVTPGATLLVRVDALDPHDNRLASKEQRVRVEGIAPPPVALDLPKPVTAPPPPAAISFTSDVPPAHPKHEGDKHGGVLSSPWFYIVGGAILAAGGAFAYYELRPSDDVSLGGARVVTR